MRNRQIRLSVRYALAAVLALASALAAAPAPVAQSVGDSEIAAAVSTALERLPLYGVFDALAFRVNRGAITVEGYAYAHGLGSAAAAALKRVGGTGEIADRVEELPVSASDDRIRWITFYSIYTDDVLSRYAPGGASGARFDVFQFGGFPGTQPGGYPIHIVVRHGRTTLVGAVDSVLDRHRTEVCAREVGGVSAVDNQLVAAR